MVTWCNAVAIAASFPGRFHTMECGRNVHDHVRGHSSRRAPAQQIGQGDDRVADHHGNHCPTLEFGVAEPKLHGCAVSPIAFSRASAAIRLDEQGGAGQLQNQWRPGGSCRSESGVAVDAVGNPVANDEGQFVI